MYKDVKSLFRWVRIEDVWWWEGKADLYWLEDLSQAGTPDSRAVTPPPSRKFMATAFCNMSDGLIVMVECGWTYSSTIIGFPCPVEIWYKIDMVDRVTRVSVDGNRIQYPGRLISSIGDRRP